MSAQLLTTLVVAVAATVAIALGHISEATYVALLAGGVAGAPAAKAATERVKP